MPDNYARIISENLAKLFGGKTTELASALPAIQEGDTYAFKAFGEACLMSPQGIFLNNRMQTGVLGILISLYALHTRPVPLVIQPLRSFKEMPDSTPYAAAFTSHTELPLVPRVDHIDRVQRRIIDLLDGQADAHPSSGDFSFLVRPLPKIALGYIFYRADDEFPASATCLFSNNAADFMPVDGLADIGEYTSKKILSLI